jgi:hypothetical protein
MSGAMLLSPAAVQADDGAGLLGPGQWRALVSPFSVHFDHNPQHEHVAGASYFSNSFGQPSAYLYVGKRYPALFDRPQLFGQWSAGLLYGYRGEFKDKVPFNHNGFSPGALLSMGWQFNKQTSATVHLLGNSGLMVQLAWDFP